jgi:hypothetical protein
MGRISNFAGPTRWPSIPVEPARAAECPLPSGPVSHALTATRVPPDSHTRCACGLLRGVAMTGGPTWAALLSPPLSTSAPHGQPSIPKSTAIWPKEYPSIQNPRRPKSILRYYHWHMDRVLSLFIHAQSRFHGTSYRKELNCSRQ